MTVEQRLREALRRTTPLAPWALAGETVLAAGRAARRRRRIAAGAGAAVLVALLTVTVALRPVPRAAPPSDDVTRGVDVLLATNEIHLSTGQVVTLPTATPVVSAWRVSGGWVLLLRGGLKDEYAELVTDDGVERAFEPPISGAVLAIGAGGTTLAAARGHDADVYDLPSGAHRTHVDLSAYMADNDYSAVIDLFLAGSDLIVVIVKELAQGPAYSTVTVDLGSGRASTPLSGLELFAVSRDGTSAAGLVQPGTDLSVPPCLTVVALARPAPVPQVCPTPGDRFAAARFSPDGRQLAVRVWTGTQSTVWVYRTADLRAGTAEPIKLSAPGQPGSITLYWLDNDQFVAEQRQPQPAYLCTVRAARCTQLDLPPTAVEAVPDLR